MQKIHKAKKSLGQNFLKSIPALNKIIEAGEISNKDVILEIGPGKGALTEKLLEKAGKVIAVEKDRDLIKFLQEKFVEEIKQEKLILIEEDILQFQISNYELRNGGAKQNVLEGTLGRRDGARQRNFSAEKFRGESENILHSNYKIIANIPYNITGAILKKFLTAKNQPELMVLMIQKEVAERIVARDKKESLLSVSVKSYGTPKIEMKVPARYFSPAPKVDSAILSIKNISRKNFNSPLEEYSANRRREVENTSTPSLQATPEVGNKFEEKFWEILHAGFAHKRKKLSSNLKKYLGPRPPRPSGTPPWQGEKILLNLGNKRAEDLSLEDWLELTK